LTLAACLAGCRQTSVFPENLWARGKKPVAAPTTVPQPTTKSALSDREKADVQMAFARTLERRGHTDQAISAYLDIIKKDKDRADARHRLALLYDKKGDAASAAKHYRDALKRDPNNAQIHSDYGYNCYLQEQWEEAESSLRRAIELRPDLKRAHNNLGLLLARRGRTEEALSAFQRAGCSEGDAHANLAVVLLLEKQWDGALAEFRVAMAANPNSQAAKHGLRAIQTARAQGQLGPAPAAGPGHVPDLGRTPIPPAPAQAPAVQVAYRQGPLRTPPPRASLRTRAPSSELPGVSGPVPNTRPLPPVPPHEPVADSANPLRGAAL
jgi:Tfp pilus assembly protein PilF